MKHILPDFQRNNLAKLATYLRGNLAAKFDMESYASTDDNYVTNCGTIGCAIGHGPYAGIPKYPGEFWGTYSNRVFGCGSRTPADIFLFNDEWSLISNSPISVANRIEYFLEHGVPDVGHQCSIEEMIIEYNKIVN